MFNNANPASLRKEFTYGRSTIEYELIYEERKNIAITVNPDGAVVVKAPVESDFDEIQSKLQKRGRWILKQINYFDKFHPLQTARKYISGETYYYLGRQYRLRIRRSKQESVKLVGKFFIVETKNPKKSEHIKLLMMQWYADHAKLVLDTRGEKYIERIMGSNYCKVEINYKYLNRRWGIWDNGTLTFNIELIKTPISCVDYVIVHELCHLVHPNHDKSFYRLMGSIIPDWVERKEKLELFGVR